MENIGADTQAKHNKGKEKHCNQFKSDLVTDMLYDLEGTRIQVILN